MEFSRKYHDEAFPARYAAKHRESVSRRLNDHREKNLLARCLALTGAPGSIIDVGCGPGRFWPVLAQTGAQRDPTARLAALDVSESMLRHALDANGEVGGRFAPVAGSVLALPIRDDAFDCVVAMRLLHHFGNAEERRVALGELTRISRRHLILSLWVDGNFKAWRRSRLIRRRGPRAYENRHLVARETLARDFQATDLSIVRHFDLIPGYSQWRYYLLEKKPRSSLPAGAAG